MCSGRRGTKRKAEVQVEEEEAAQPSVEEEEKGAGGENSQEGPRVVIEHW